MPFGLWQHPHHLILKIRAHDQRAPAVRVYFVGLVLWHDQAIYIALQLHPHRNIESPSIRRQQSRPRITTGAARGVHLIGEIVYGSFQLQPPVFIAQAPVEHAIGRQYAHRGGGIGSYRVLGIGILRRKITVLQAGFKSPVPPLAAQLQVQRRNKLHFPALYLCIRTLEVPRIDHGRIGEQGPVAVRMLPAAGLQQVQLQVGFQAGDQRLPDIGPDLDQ